MNAAAMSLAVRGLPCGPPKRSSAVRMCRLVKIIAMTSNDTFATLVHQELHRTLFRLYFAIPDYASLFFPSHCPTRRTFSRMGAVSVTQTSRNGHSTSLKEAADKDGDQDQDEDEDDQEGEEEVEEE